MLLLYRAGGSVADGSALEFVNSFEVGVCQQPEEQNCKIKKNRNWSKDGQYMSIDPGMTQKMID